MSINNYNVTNKNIDFTSLLLLAKDNDESAKEAIIKQFYALIVYQSKEIFLSAYTYDDLIQTGIVSLLKAIESFDINKGIQAFSSYVFWCVKNNFNYLCRQEIRYNQCYSLNTVLKDGMESIDFIASDGSLEEIVFGKITSMDLKSALNLLTPEELDLISFLYLGSSNEDKGFLSKYAKIKDKDYYYCTRLKKHALSKLKTNLGHVVFH